ncbi:hypothetical protein LXL04_009345 [Taraxacum kok-saghyz]
MRGEREKREKVRRAGERGRKQEREWATRMKKVAEYRGSFSAADSSYGGRETSFFFTNFPESWPVAKLWAEFRGLGNLVDVFIARNRNKRGRKFGFIKFLGSLDVKEMELKLKSFCLDGFNLRANIAKYGRKEKLLSPEPPKKMKSIIVNVKDQARVEDDKPKRSYAEAVSGSTTPIAVASTSTTPTHPIPYPNAKHLTHPRNAIEVIPSPEMKERLDRTVVGEVRNYNTLLNIQELRTVEGLGGTKCSLWGGLCVSLEFGSPKAASEYLRLEKPSWSKWFSKLGLWSADFRVQRRLAALSIIGLPPQAWCPSVISEVASIWGKLFP